MKGQTMEKLFSVPLKKNNLCLRGRFDITTGGISGSEVSTDTYYGCFPCEVYSENTNIKDVLACMRIKGSGKAELFHVNNNIEKVISSRDFDNSAYESIFLSFSLPSDGYCYLKLTVSPDASDGFEISDIWYEGSGKENETKISIIICTYHREEYVERTLRKLKQAITSEKLENTVEIICVDNGNTLMNTPPGIKLIKNRNYGGSGGYARGMMEAVGSTHFWLMDDDIKFEKEIVRRGAAFFKYRKSDDISLAASMFSFEEPTVQYEATAVFNGFTFTSNAAGLDFRNRDVLLRNRIEQTVNTYGGWWSFITPVRKEDSTPDSALSSGLSSDNTELELPMPFFIKMDDVEYSLRMHRTGSARLVIMSGFGVWHEAFGKKGNAWTEYYTTRNTLIVQNLYPDLPHNSVKMMGIRLLKALAYGEPKCMAASLRAVEDYIAGPEQFRKIDPEMKHRAIMDEFCSPLTQNMNRKKMMKSALIHLLNLKNWKSVGLFCKSVFLLRKRKDMDWRGLCKKDFWRDYLGVQ